QHAHDAHRNDDEEEPAPVVLQVHEDQTDEDCLDDGDAQDQRETRLRRERFGTHGAVHNERDDREHRERDEDGEIELKRRAMMRVAVVVMVLVPWMLLDMFGHFNSSVLRAFSLPKVMGKLETCPHDNYTRYSNGNRKIQTISTKCQ